NISTRKKPGYISRPIQPISSLSAEWVGYESLTRKFRPPDISPRYPRPRNINLSSRSYRNRLMSPAEHVYLRISNRSTDRRQFPSRFIHIHLVSTTPYPRLRRPILIDQPRRSRTFLPILQSPGLQFLSPNHEHSHAPLHFPIPHLLR